VRTPETQPRFEIYDQISNILKQIGELVKVSIKNHNYSELYKLGIAIRNLLKQVPVQPTARRIWSWTP